MSFSRDSEKEEINENETKTPLKNPYLILIEKVNVNISFIGYINYSLLSGIKKIYSIIDQQ